MYSFLQSFAPAVVRTAVVIFGLCYIAFLTIELIAKWNRDCTCWARRNLVINFVNIVFVVLQAFLIVYYPRLNLHINGYIDRCTLIQTVLIMFLIKYNSPQNWMHAPHGDQSHLEPTHRGS